VENPYLPYPVRIDDIIVETEDRNLKTFKFVFINPEDEEKFAYQAGQFAELSIAGKGEIPIGIASSPTEKGFVKFTVNKVGLVTSPPAQHAAGRCHGHPRPHGKLVSLGAAGGQKRRDCRRRFRLHHPAQLHHLHAGPIDQNLVIFTYLRRKEPRHAPVPDELAEWEKRDDINMHITVDGTDDPDWKYNVGFVPP
jgi:sulfhydrogenase subunit gamma (sulfur reductase)